MTQLNGIRDRLNTIAQEILQGHGDPVPATPDLGYVNALGAGFWVRADKVEVEDRHYVDGYWGQCHWNTAMTAIRKAGGIPAVGVDQSALIIASPVRIFRGYAYFYSPSGLGNGWAEHSWCMEGNILLETTGPMVAYFGAELNAQEKEHLAHGVAGHDPTAGHGGLGWGLDHDTPRIPIAAVLIANTIGLPSVPQPPDHEDDG